MVEYLDKLVGRLTDALDRLGIAENTIVVFTADNGTQQRLSSQWRGHSVQGGKGSYTDRGARVPFIVRWPAKIEEGTVTGKMVEFADMLPTFVDLAGRSMPGNEVDGTSFAPLLRGDDGFEPKPFVHWQNNPSLRALRSHRWIYFSNGRLKAVQPYPFDAVRIDPEGIINEQYQNQYRTLKQEIQTIKK